MFTVRLPVVPQIYYLDEGQLKIPVPKVAPPKLNYSLRELGFYHEGFHFFRVSAAWLFVMH